MSTALLARPVIDDATRREFLTGLAAAGLLAGCGTAPTTSTPTPQTRTLDTALGPVQVPTRPQRVVAMFGGAELFALGLTPVVMQPGILPAVLDDEVTAVEVLLDANEPDLEQVAAARPDLILATAADGEVEFGDQLAAIAPVAAFESSSQWKDYLRFYADAVNQPEQANEVLAAYDDRATALRDTLGEAGLTETVRVLRVSGDGLSVYQRDTFAGTVLDDVGIAAPPDDAEDRFAEELSAEQITEADADHIFVWTYGNTDEAASAAALALEQLQANPLWGRLRAVAAGQVYLVGDHWIGGGPAAANAILDDLQRHLA